MSTLHDPPRLARRRRFSWVKGHWGFSENSEGIRAVAAQWRSGACCGHGPGPGSIHRSEEHTSELQSHLNLVCRLLLEKKKNKKKMSLQNAEELPPCHRQSSFNPTLTKRHQSKAQRN